MILCRNKGFSITGLEFPKKLLTETFHPKGEFVAKPQENS